MSPGALIVVAMVNPAAAPPTFRRRRLEWPLHVTIVPWFQVPDDQTFLKFLERHSSSYEMFTAVVGTDATFGDTQEIPVSLIQNTEPFKILHNYVLELLSDTERATLVNTKWLRESYQPHVTHHGLNRLHEGDSFVVQGLTVVRLLEDDICEVIGTMRFKEQS